MTTERTFLPGKDEALEVSVEKMQSLLAEHGFPVEEKSWLHPLTDAWSVHLKDRDCPLLCTNGKGVNRISALASALGEFFERSSCDYFFAGFYLGGHAQGEFVRSPEEKWFPTEHKRPRGLLNGELWKLYDPTGELEASGLVDRNTADRGRGVCALPFVRVRDGCRTYFPVNVLDNLYVSNGMAAGNSESEARVQALSEIFERHVKNRVIAEGMSLPDIPAQVVERHPRAGRIVRELRENGFPVLLRDASLGGRYPVLNATLLNPKNGTCFLSFGAHPRFEVALERSLTEMLQGRQLADLQAFSPPSFDSAGVADPQNLEAHFVNSDGEVSWDFFRDRPDFAFCDWNFEGDTRREFEHLCGIVHSDSREIYLADYRHMGFHACRIVVPGMSEIYPFEDLLWENDNSGAFLRKDFFRLHDLDAAGLSKLLAEMEEAMLPDAQPVAEWLGLAVDPESPWGKLRTGGIKCLIHLAIGDLEGASFWSDCQRGFSEPQAEGEGERFYACLDALLTLALDPMRKTESYLRALADLYGKDNLEVCRRLVSGEIRFHGLPRLDPDFRSLPLHAALMEAYGKLQGLKAKSGKK